MSFSHRSAWYSPRGFANDGYYVYGTTKEMDNFFEEEVISNENCDWDCLQSHHSEELALARCERDMCKDERRYKRCAEVSYIYAIYVQELKNQLRGYNDEY